MQRDYFDNADCIGWTRGGGELEKDGCAAILSNAGSAKKRMEMGQQYAGKVFMDKLQKIKEEVTIDNDGWGEFLVAERSVSVWVLT